MDEFITAFLEWFWHDNHSQWEDIYKDEITLENLRRLTKEEFIEFFERFAHEGGRIQSGGYRTTPKFIENVRQKYDDFRKRILEPFSQDFDLDSWLQWAERFSYFGKGLATIYLNRVDKNKYVVVNNKSIEGLQKLGYEIHGGNLLYLYHSVERAERSLLENYPILGNFFRIDAMMHFLIGEEEGKKAYENFLGESFFDLEGLKEYASLFGAEYNRDSPATKLYKDTQNKLEYLVSLLGKKLNQNYVVNYRERPNKQPGGDRIVRLKSYVLVGFAPKGLNPDGKLFIKLAFHFLNKQPVFDIEIDVDAKIRENPYMAGREKRVEQTRLRIPVDQDFPENWQDLLNSISEHINKLTDVYKEITERSKTQNSDSVKQGPLNMIYYGPPGTGKTFWTINEALELLGEDVNRFKNRGEFKQKFAEYQKAGRIYFTTFHQNMAYEDFIEGIKPVSPEEEEETLKYEVQDGLFMQACIEATFNYIHSNFTDSDMINNLMDFNDLYDELYMLVAENNKRTLKTKSGLDITVYVSPDGNFRIQHNERETKHIVHRDKLMKIYEVYPNPEEITNVHNEIRDIIGSCDYTAYWSVLNAIAKIREERSGKELRGKDKFSYKDKKSIVREYWNKKEYNPLGEDRSDPYVFIIDEINRGNVAQIFGELITLIEDDKRMGKTETLYAELPYSKTSFAVPPNLYIIGTMNTADRSVEALDTALRRRFDFKYFGPEPEHEKLKKNIEGINLSQLLQTMNDRIEILKDKDHMVGHAWLMNIETLDDLKSVFGNKILPLLQEYFYNDYEKLGLVLGDAFFEVQDQVDSNIFASFKGGSDLRGQYTQAYRYALKPVQKLKAEDFLSLISKEQNPEGEEQ